MVEEVEQTVEQPWGRHESEYEGAPFAAFEKDRAELLQKSRFYDVFLSRSKAERHGYAFKPTDDDDQYLIERTAILSVTPLDAVKKETAPVKKYEAEPQRQYFGKNAARFNYVRTNRVTRPESIMIRPEWLPITELSWQNLKNAKHTIPAAEKADKNDYAAQFASEEVATEGTLPKYNEAIERHAPRKPTRLPADAPRRTNSIRSDKTAKSIIEKIDPEGKTTVVASASALSLVMAALRTHNGWDVLVTKQGKAITLDYRPENEFADLVPLDESSTTMTEDPLATYAEAAAAIAEYRAAATDGSKGQVRWRKIAVDDEIDVVVKTHVDAEVKQKRRVQVEAVGPDGEPMERVEIVEETVPAIVKAVVETADHGTWLSKWQSMKATIFGEIIIKNSALTDRWAIEGLLAGADAFKMGFVARNNPKDASKHHHVVGAHDETMEKYAKNVMMEAASCWGVFKAVVDDVRGRADGQYVLVHTPNSTSLQLYNHVE
ncbi:Eukaryotic translation initiation factor 3 subunit D [Carpediemonas membranifera]|uniref:Eukaryotic translation initiation factor 3 subunit D n=1 Tax=Carpediemonas membranifera TaxID=201153 RepID=A0A8J6B5I9_9EUKA|nr:Eukaryotic translation initiation factor 3 subunit D [Carpediemonas membranifera]|eukprot:KAG9390462.1 Eukaryotic translation initiation factor 3 subunit D [Carpediemonas membranifera]